MPAPRKGSAESRISSLTSRMERCARFLSADKSVIPVSDRHICFEALQYHAGYLHRRSGASTTAHPWRIYPCGCRSAKNRTARGLQNTSCQKRRLSHLVVRKAFQRLISLDKLLRINIPGLKAFQKIFHRRFTHAVRHLRAASSPDH